MALIRTQIIIRVIPIITGKLTVFPDSVNPQNEVSW